VNHIEADFERSPAMSDALEFERLAELHRQGVLNDDEFGRAKARVLGAGATTATPPNSPPNSPPIANALNSLRRSRSDRWIGGVCGGIAQLTGLAAWVWRIVFTVLLCAGGGSLVLYLLLWLFVPEEWSSNQTTTGSAP
jgi:phage shock protein C